MTKHSGTAAKDVGNIERPTDPGQQKNSFQ